jgi:hypothetical protein
MLRNYFLKIIKFETFEKLKVFLKLQIILVAKSLSLTVIVVFFFRHCEFLSSRHCEERSDEAISHSSPSLRTEGLASVLA